MTASDTPAREQVLIASNAAENAFGTRVTALGDGRCHATTVVPPASDSSGWLGPLADVLLARAAMSLDGAPMGCRTIDLRIDFLTAADPPAGSVVGRGVLRDLDGGFALCDAIIEAPDGRPVARCVGRLRLVPAHPDQIRMYTVEAGNHRTTRSLPDLFGLAWRERTGAGGLLEVAGDPDVGNPFGVMHGGAQHSLLVVAAEEFCRPEPDRWRPLDATLAYLAPMPACGPGLTVLVAVDGRTRNLLRLRVEFRAPLGRTASGLVTMRRVDD
ncbi:PaaI family thioesterase [Phytohabitans sp. ZYX-F-186]|uniref:PaaI family thioesterase n=1 Tax=Phytohabitans maris TaxID=3071409 RepID=A0ABU0ZMH5_9ACTN|nr:PaaI family thioesterase [Phytohabitans sp. ZYX-F-186]MDQ7907475.1 PaaI family thioesterase [Phytohabitans sp. ZYX-F-186]